MVDSGSQRTGESVRHGLRKKQSGLKTLGNMGRRENGKLKEPQRLRPLFPYDREALSILLGSKRRLGSAGRAWSIPMVYRDGKQMYQYP